MVGGLLLKHAEHRHFLEPALNHVTMEENAPSPYLVELKDEVTKLDPAEFSHAARLISEGKTCSTFLKYVFKQVNDDLVFVFKITGRFLKRTFFSKIPYLSQRSGSGKSKRFCVSN